MPWVRFDDQFPIHRKVDGLSDAAYRLHTSAIFWCARNLTDGFVSEDDLDGVTARVRTPARFASECVKRGTWHEARFDCPSPKCAAPVDADGWVIHDYMEYQPSREQVLADRKKAAERQARWREAKAGKPGSNAVTRPDMSENDPIHNGSTNGVTNAVSASSPPRPAPKEAGRAAPAPSAPNGRAIPAGSPSGGRPDNQSVVAALRNAIEPGHRAASYGESHPAADAARAAMAAKRKPP
jgi:hypothetical protein